MIDRPTTAPTSTATSTARRACGPALDRWLTLHNAVDADRDELEPSQHAALRVLHYESFSGEDFVRKWTAMLGVGADRELPAGPRAHRGRAAHADRQGPEREQARAYLMRIFERTTEDDFETLRDLGLLVEVDPRAGTHAPEAFPPARRDALTGRWSELRDRSPSGASTPARPADEAGAGQASGQRVGLLRRS